VIECQPEVVADVAGDEGDAGGQGIPDINERGGVAFVVLAYHPKSDPVGVMRGEPPHDAAQRPKMEISSLELLSGTIHTSSVSYPFQRGNNSRRD